VHLDVSAGGRHHDTFISYAVYAGNPGQDLSERDAPLNEVTLFSPNHAAISNARGFSQGFQGMDLDRQLDQGVRCMRLECWWNENDDTIYSTVDGQIERRTGLQSFSPGTRTQRLRNGAVPETLHEVLRDNASWLAANRDEVVVLRFDYSSARAFLVYEAELRQRGRQTEGVLTKITVVNRGSWGELRFSAWD